METCFNDNQGGICDKELNITGANFYNDTVFFQIGPE